MQHVRRELLIPGKKRLSRDFQCFFSRSEMVVKRNEAGYSLLGGEKQKNQLKILKHFLCFLAA